MAYLELNDTKNNIIHEYSSNKEWFEVKSKEGKIKSFLFKHSKEASKNKDTFSSEYDSYMQYLKHLKITSEIFNDEMTLKALQFLKKNSTNKTFKFDQSLIEFLLKVLKQQISDTKFNRESMYILIQIIYNYSNYNTKFNIEFQSTDNTLSLIFECLQFFIKIGDKRLISNVVFIIYYLSKKTHIPSIQKQWNACEVFENLLNILDENLESLTDPIIERIVCTVKASYDLITESNESETYNDEYLFNNDQTLSSINTNEINIFKYFNEMAFKESILKNRLFRDAFIYFINMFDGFNTKFDNLNDSNKKITIETLTNFTKFIMDLLKAELIAKTNENKKKLIKLFGYLIDVLNLSTNLSFESSYLRENFQKLKNGLPLLIEFIANNMINASKQNKIIYFLLFERVYHKILTLITLIYEYSANYSTEYDWNNLQTIEKFVKSTLKMKEKDITKSLKIILFQYGFKHQTENDLGLDVYQNYFLSDDSFKFKQIQNSINQLLLIDEIAKVFEKRSYLNAILYLHNDDRFFSSLSYDTQKKFIEFSVEFFEYVLGILDILPMEPKFDHSFVYSIKVLLYFNKLININTEISNRSDQFCLDFNQNSKNGILILFKLLTHENTFSYSVGSKKSNKINNILTTELTNHILHLLLNLSRASYDFKSIWNETVDSLLILKELALKLSNTNKTFELLCFMTISNIASDDDILKLADENSHVIKSIVDEISILASMLESNSAERIEIKLNEKNSVRVVSNYISGWHLIEVRKNYVCLGRALKI